MEDEFCNLHSLGIHSIHTSKPRRDKLIVLPTCSWVGQIYITLEGASQEKIEARFHSDSVDLKIHDVGGKNYRCSVPKLNKSIIPEQPKMLVKPKRIIVTLKKADGGNWIDLHKKEEKVPADFLGCKCWIK